MIGCVEPALGQSEAKDRKGARQSEGKGASEDQEAAHREIS